MPLFFQPEPHGKAESDAHDALLDAGVGYTCRHLRFGPVEVRYFWAHLDGRTWPRFRTRRALWAYVRALVLALALTTTTTDAAGGWRLGHLTPGSSASFWYREQPTGAWPVAAVDAGEAGAWCGGPAEEPQTCVVYAQGAWTVLTVDGEAIHRRGRVWLPEVGR